MSGFFASDDTPPVVDATTDLLTAEASSVDGFPEDPVAPDPSTLPIGRTWPFDWGTGRFRRQGGAPAEVRDHDSLGVWIETTLRIGRYAYGIFSDAYGLEEAEAPIGEIVTPAMLSDLSRRIRAALLVHDRIQSVDGIVLAVDGDTIIVRSLEAVYDQTNQLSVRDVKVTG